MAYGGFTKLPGGSVVVALSLPRPLGAGGMPGSLVRVLVHAANRQRALTRLRNLGLRAVYLRGNTEPPTPDEVTAVLHHPDGLVWRAVPECGGELWHPIRALLRPVPPPAPAAPRGGGGPSGLGVPGGPDGPALIAPVAPTIPAA